MRIFQRPFDSADVARHDIDCGLKNAQTRTVCHARALTFDEAHHLKVKLTGERAVPNPKDRDFKAVPATTCHVLLDMPSLPLLSPGSPYERPFVRRCLKQPQKIPHAVKRRRRN
jgi:hypothetical protein